LTIRAIVAGVVNRDASERTIRSPRRATFGSLSIVVGRLNVRAG
jgi:hypothetical protein